MATPEFVVVGHVTRDLTRDGWLLGGTVTFASVQAHRLGRSVGIVTRAEPEVIARLRQELPFAEIAAQPSDATTTFENVYELGHRTQHIRARAPMIAPEDVPEAWRTSEIVLLGAVFGEIAPEFADALDATLVGGSAQGWLRSADDASRVRPSRWEGPLYWRGWDVVFVSDEDLGGDEAALEAWTRDVPIVAMTESHRGARIWADGRWRWMDAFPEQEVDPTGAGDTFATGFLIRLHETGDSGEAARFGAAAASLSVGGIGVDAMPERAEVEERMRAQPGIVLRPVHPEEGDSIR